MTAPEGISSAELDAQQAAYLPDREAMSLVGEMPDTSTLLGDTSLLNVDVNLAADLDLAAPVNAAVAANANVAAPIDAAVSANVASVGSTSVASADQAVLINQNLEGTATATAEQDSVIEQGETGA